MQQRKHIHDDIMINLDHATMATPQEAVAATTMTQQWHNSGLQVARLAGSQQQHHESPQ